MRVPAIDPTQSLQPSGEPGGARNRYWVFGSQVHQDPDTPHAFAVLCASSDRPRDRNTAQKRNEVPPPHSITSSARARIVGGTVSPSVFAALRLMTSLNVLAW